MIQFLQSKHVIGLPVNIGRGMNIVCDKYFYIAFNNNMFY